MMKSYWTKKKIKLKQKFAGVTNKDLFFKQGSEYEMLEKLRNKVGKSAKELLSIIIEF
jgi:hypothetical protein